MDSGINKGSIVKSVASNNEGKLVLTYADTTTSDPIEVHFVATETSSVSLAEALNVNGTAVGSATQPVYFDNQGKPQIANKIPKLNNISTDSAFYAPTAAGTSGQLLVSSGGTPTWQNASSLTIGTASNVSSAGVGNVNAARHVWFSDSQTETLRNHDDDFAYNPSTNTLSVPNLNGTATRAIRDGDGNTISSTYLKLSGGTFTNIDSVFFKTGNTLKITPKIGSIIQSPVPKYKWHDIFAFSHKATPTFYTTTDNITWTEATLDKRPFSQLQDFSLPIITETQTGARWVWNSTAFSYSSATWLTIGFSYSIPTAEVTIVFETSSNGTTWVKRHESNYASSSQPVWFYIDGYGADSYLRLTITKDTSDTTGTCNINAIKLLSSRWGNQGGGSEYEFPYTWDANKNMTATGTFSGTFNGNATTATKATQDGDGNTISSTYLKRSGGAMTGNLTMNGTDIILGTSASTSNDSGDLIWKYGNGNEKMKLWSDNTYTAKSGPNFRMYNDEGTQLYSGKLPLADGTSATGTWEISITGNAATATKATQDANGATIASTYAKLSGATFTGAVSGTSFSASSYMTVNSGNSSTAGGLALYETDPTSYGIAMRGSSNSGTHGYASGYWHTYLYMSGGTTRGWIFKNQSVGNIASISGDGNAVFNGSVTVGGNATNTGGMRMQYDANLKCTNFIFN